MRSWGLAFPFGFAGAVAGAIAAKEAGNSSAMFLAGVGGAGLFALLGAVLGGDSEIVEAIRGSKHGGTP